MSVNYGSKRVVTGARYGLRDWLAQRITGALVALLTLIVLPTLYLWAHGHEDTAPGANRPAAEPGQ